MIKRLESALATMEIVLFFILNPRICPRCPLQFKLPGAASTTTQVSAESAGVDGQPLGAAAAAATPAGPPLRVQHMPPPLRSHVCYRIYDIIHNACDTAPAPRRLPAAYHAAHTSAYLRPSERLPATRIAAGRSGPGPHSVAPVVVL